MCWRVCETDTITLRATTESAARGSYRNATPLQGVAALLANLALVLVLALEHLASDEQLERLLDVLLVLDFDRQAVEGLQPLGPMGALLGDELIRELAAEHIAQELFFLGSLEVVLQLGEQVVEELVGIHLLSRVHRLAVIVLRVQSTRCAAVSVAPSGGEGERGRQRKTNLVRRAELDGVVITLDALHQVGEEHLHLVQQRIALVRRVVVGCDERKISHL